MSFQNILVPSDGSKFAGRSFKTALVIAKKSKAKITVVTVLGRYVSGTWYVDNRISDSEWKYQYKAAKKQFEEMNEAAQKSKVPFSSKILESQNIGKSIVNFAKSKKIDLIVMGSHGRTGLDKLLLGSVANRVSNTSHCSILLVK